MTVLSELAEAGWVRVGPYSPYWKAPGDTGPTGRKWMVAAAHAELTRTKTAEPEPPKPRARRKPAASE